MTAVASPAAGDGASGHRNAEYWRREAIEARCQAGALAAIHGKNKVKLEAVRAEMREFRQQAKEPLRATAEAARLRRLLARLPQLNHDLT